MINIKTNIAQFINTEIKRYAKIQTDATVSTTNKIARQGLTESQRSIREEYNVKLKDLNKDHRGKRLMYVTTTTRLSKPAVITAVAVGISLGKFKAKQKETGVEVQVRKSGSPKIIKHAFGPRIARLGRSVFTRYDPKISGEYRERSGRLPIYRLYGPSPARMFMNKTVEKRLRTMVATKFPIVFAQEMKYRMNK